ncbi:hypothetical protein PGTUg99_014780 [Puccinia graminis f. sp. tritici]|uniref:Uncharacterized protein n=1 Tax=Puccinia graminis f. sp. tritici TaxID=56615 RepID=A0A5B0PH28_PUCGR|nr:hypothetical protein PGTUg99_014780 [Puccinia graminis f. sp. tritici]
MNNIIANRVKAKGLSEMQPEVATVANPAEWSNRSGDWSSDANGNNQYMRHMRPSLHQPQADY